MKDILLNNRHFTIRLDTHTAGIASLSHPSDRHRMNWICHCDEQPWFPAGFGWGLGFLCMPTDGLPLLRWQRPEKQISSKNSAQCLYHAGAIAVTVARRLRGKFLDETYVLRNCSGSEVTIWGVGIYLPFNDNYPNATTCVTRRCNAHLWCGGSVSWACALRMGGEPPHLGLVVTEGDFSGYSIEGRGLGMGGSNVRGAIVFNHTGFTLGKGASRR
ncbi:MAG: hypothetical protein N3A66_05695, partial [Planctomycetota bacterium]|nr:hypothetical protein [Planctomycetota bacterium]